jgi:transcriptional regulator
VRQPMLATSESLLSGMQLKVLLLNLTLSMQMEIKGLYTTSKACFQVLEKSDVILRAGGPCHW